MRWCKLAASTVRDGMLQLATVNTMNVTPPARLFQSFGSRRPISIRWLPLPGRYCPGAATDTPHSLFASYHSHHPLLVRSEMEKPRCPVTKATAFPGSARGVAGASTTETHHLFVVLPRRSPKWGGITTMTGPLPSRVRCDLLFSWPVASSVTARGPRSSQPPDPQSQRQGVCRDDPGLLSAGV